MSGILGDVFRALWQAALPVGITSFLLVWWALKHEYFGPVSSMKEMERLVKQHSRTKKKNKKDLKIQNKAQALLRKESNSDEDLLDESDIVPIHALNPVHNKWLKFGGGFYGVVALLTYVVVEFAEIGDFLSNFHGFLGLLADINIQMLIRLIVDSMINFVKAIAWPAYWLDSIRSNQPWVWFLAAYFGYWLGARWAVLRFSENLTSGE